MLELHPTLNTLYSYYCKQLPLDLSTGASEAEKTHWRNTYQLSCLGFSRIVARIQQRRQLGQMAQLGLDMDFDNFYPVLATLHAHGYLQFKGSAYTTVVLPTPLMLPEAVYESPEDVYTSPNVSYNQFPCTLDARLSRVRRLLADYPYATNLRVGLIGDDDGLAVALARWTPFTPVVFEADTSLLGLLSSVRFKENLKIEIHAVDLQKAEQPAASFDTFITDPPYTLQGVLHFLYYGLSGLCTNDRFYLISNQMMLGSHARRQILLLLSQCGAVLETLTPQFNEYPLPANFRETRDLSAGLAKIGGELPAGTLSSASSLFAFDLTSLDISPLRAALDPDRSLYARYGETI